MKFDVNFKLVDTLRTGTNFVLFLVETLLGLRVVLKLFNANVSNDFVSWVYDTSAPLIDPFVDMFTTVRVEGAVTVEFAALFAMIVFGVLAFVLLALYDRLESKVVRR